MGISPEVILCPHCLYPKTRGDLKCANCGSVFCKRCGRLFIGKEENE